MQQAKKLLREKRTQNKLHLCGEGVRAHLPPLHGGATASPIPNDFVHLSNIKVLLDVESFNFLCSLLCCILHVLILLKNRWFFWPPADSPPPAGWMPWSCAFDVKKILSESDNALDVSIEAKPVYEQFFVCVYTCTYSLASVFFDYLDFSCVCHVFALYVFIILLLQKCCRTCSRLSNLCFCQVLVFKLNLQRIVETTSSEFCLSVTNPSAPCPVPAPSQHPPP